MKKYNVYVFDYDFRIVKVIGENIPTLLAIIKMKQAERKLKGQYFVNMIEVKKLQLTN